MLRIGQIPGIDTDAAEHLVRIEPDKSRHIEIVGQRGGANLEQHIRFLSARTSAASRTAGADSRRRRRELDSPCRDRKSRFAASTLRVELRNLATRSQPRLPRSVDADKMR